MQGAIHLPPRKRANLNLELLGLPLGLALIILLWAGVASQYPAFILPDPLLVLRELFAAASTGLLWPHARATLLAIVGGLALGLTTAMSLGYVLAKSQLLERLATPYVVISQSIPIIAIAPLVIIWFGSGLWSKILICALIVFFPVLVNTIVGIRSVDENLRTMMRAMRATRWQMFTMLEVPAAMPVLLGGLKIGVTLSVIGAVVGEFVGANQGLGYLINVAKGLFNTPLMFAAMLTLVVISLTLYLLVTAMERWLLSWQR